MCYLLPVSCFYFLVLLSSFFATFIDNRISCHNQVSYLFRSLSTFISGDRKEKGKKVKKNS